jgi:hypothetical protein
MEKKKEDNKTLLLIGASIAGFFIWKKWYHKDNEFNVGALRKHEIDKDKLREIFITATNEHSLYNMFVNVYVPALQKFIDKGNFDEIKALKLLEYFVKRVVIRLNQRPYEYNLKLNPLERLELAKEYLEEFNYYHKQ